VPPVRVRLTAAKFGLRRHRKLRLARPQGSGSTSTMEDDLRLARPQGSDCASPDPRARAQPRPRKTDSASPDPRARAQPRPRKTISASPDPRARTQPRPRTMVSATPDPRARTQPRPRTTVSASPDPRARTQPRPWRSLHLARPWARTDHVAEGHIITLPLASSGYGEQDRRPIWLVPVKQVMMAPRVLHDDGSSQPPTEARRRQQGLDNSDSCAPTGLKRSSDGHDVT
jgi:hypothetical protein